MWSPSKLRRILPGPLVKSIDKQGEVFFESGRLVVQTLDALAQLLKSRDFDSVANLYDRAFTGHRFSIAPNDLLEEAAHIRRGAFHSASAVSGCQEATGVWQSYLDRFASIEQLSLHLECLEKLHEDGRIETSVRLELIGALLGEVRPGVDRLNFRVVWHPEDDGLCIAQQSLLTGERLLCDRPYFTEVGQTAGIDFKNRYYPQFLSEPLKFGMIRYGPGGITAVDYDNDGFYDLFIPDGVESKLFRNRGDGTFEDVTAAAGLAGLDGVSAAIFADYDNDGFKDIFVSRTFRPNQLFHNNGDGTFTDVTRKSGIGEDSCTTVAAWADYDNDGFLDLYVGRYLDPRKDIPTTFYARNGEPNQLYHNNGDGTFTNVTAKAGVGERGLCLGVVWGDVNDDGYPDLYVVNDFGRKTLYRNNRNGTFTDITVKSRTLAYGAGMSASFVDYDNDGKFDLYVTHIRSDHAWFAAAPTVMRYMLKCMTQGTWKTDMSLYLQIMRQSGRDFVSVFRQMASGNTLLRNIGDGTFEDVTVKANANPPGWFWGASFADFDNDGWQDLYVANGWVYNDRGTEIELEFLNNVVSHQDTYKTGLYFDPNHFGRSSWHGWERNRYLRNNGDGTFLELGQASGTDLILNSRGVAVADFWNRGVMDITVSASTDHHALLKNEVGLQRNWLQVELVGTRSNRDAVGARITLFAGGKQQSREVVLGDGYGSQNSLRQHFGLGHLKVVEKLTVRWPTSGCTQIFEQVAVNQIVEVTEDSDRLITKTYPTVGQGAYVAVSA
jgi:ASPIC and UnbV/FG-GAP-like repeat